MQLENIRLYLQQSEILGVSSGYRFAADDLLDAKNMEKVYPCHLLII